MIKFFSYPHVSAPPRFDLISVRSVIQEIVSKPIMPLGVWNLSLFTMEHYRAQLVVCLVSDTNRALKCPFRQHQLKHTNAAWIWCSSHPRDCSVTQLLVSISPGADRRMGQHVLRVCLELEMQNDTSDRPPVKFCVLENPAQKFPGGGLETRKKN